MKRELEIFKNRTFDVLIVGGGIYGAAAAREAASRGLSTALIERGDFGGRTSANSLKTIHGGLRYLQTLDLKRFRESVRERKILLRIAPHLVHPLPVVMPTYGHLGKGPEIMRAGLLINDLLSIDRNAGMEKSRHIPPGRILSKGCCMHLVPGIDERNVTGAAFWTDAQMVNSERMCLAFIRSAVRDGAVVANYVSAVGFLLRQGRIRGVAARDELTGGEFEIHAKVVLNACGGWADDLFRKSRIKLSRPILRLSTAMNLIIKRELLPETAAGVQSRFKYTRRDGSVFRGSRVLFLSPWRHYTLAGTFHRPFEGDPDGLEITEHEIRIALDEVNGACPGAAILRQEVTFAHKGFLPMDGVDPKTGEVRLTKHYHIRDHGHEDGAEGLMSVAGVKYTTARDVAERTVGRILKKLGRRAASSTRTKPLAGGDIHAFPTYLNHFVKSDPYALSDDVRRHLVCQYGTDHVSVLRLIEEDADRRNRIPGSHEVTEAEVVYAVREEMAQKLSDVLLRRTDLGSGEYPGDAAVERCAGIMAGELGWHPDRIRSEVEEVQSIYRLFR